MARFEFGGTTADFVFSTSLLVGRRVISTTPAVLTFWTAKTGGTRHADLLVNGAAATSVTTNADGMIPRFFGPDLVQEMWVDAGAGERMFLQLTAGGAALAAATSASVAQAAEEGAVLRRDQSVAAKNAAEAAAANASGIALGDAAAAVTVATAPLLENERTVSDQKYALINGAPLSQSPGKNLYDKNADYGANTFWNGASGTPIALASWHASPLIPVTVGQTYVWNAPRNVVTFNAGAPVLLYNNGTEAPYSLTIPSGVTHIGFSVAATKRDVAQMELGTVPTSYEPFGMKLQRQLVNGDYLDAQVADAKAMSEAARRAGQVTVYKTGTDLLIRSAFDSSQDILMPLTLSGQLVAGGETTTAFATAAHTSVRLVPTVTRAVDVWPTLAPSLTSTAIHGPADDACPLNINGHYVGANHGWPTASKVTMTAHGKTNADRGSQWTDGTRTYTLLRVIDANTLVVGHQYSVGGGGSVSPSTVAPAATLTHVSGAVNTASITITGGVVAQQLHPSTHSRTAMATLDGKFIGDGTAVGQALSIAETYSIVSFKGLIDWSRANIGADPFANLGAMPQVARVSNTYRFTESQVIVAQTVTALEGIAGLNMGVTQAIALTIPAGGSLRQFAPGVGTVSGVDLSTLATITTLPAQLDIGAAQHLTTDPANRAIQWAYTSGGVKAWGLALGILPVMDGKPATRRANGADTRSWFVSQTFKKNYPQLAWGKTLTAGQSLSGVAYRRYLPASAPPEVVIHDGARQWLTIDLPDAAATAQTAKVPSLLGKKLTVVGTSTLTRARDYVDGEGVTYTGTAPGYLLAEAVVDTSV